MRTVRGKLRVIRKRLTTTVLLAVSLMAFSQCAADPARPATELIRRLEAGERQSIVVYGTSLTAGGAWVSQLTSQLNADYPGQINWSNGALSGKASNSGLARLSERVLAHDPDAVFIEFATNDAFTAYAEGDIDAGISPLQARENLLAMIEEVRAQNPMARIILQTMNPAWDAPNGNQSGSKRPHLEQYFQVYRDVADEERLLLIDNYPVWRTLRENSPDEFAQRVADGVHPDATGYQRYVTPAIRHALGAEMGLTLLVDVESGRVAMSNQSDDARDLIGYTIASPSGSLLPGWQSLAGHGVAGWSEANPTTFNLSELNATGSTVLHAGALHDLGHAWNEAMPLDLAFRYQTADGTSQAGAVVYTIDKQTLGRSSGDYNNDGVVNAADYTVWRDTLGGTGFSLLADGDGNLRVDGGDIEVWADHYGLTFQVAGRILAVPEPARALLLGAGVVWRWSKHR
jgi:acyl-CoA thioesterase-1